MVAAESRGAAATTFLNLFFRGQLMWNPDADVAALLGASPSEIALTASDTAAWTKALWGLAGSGWFDGGGRVLSVSFNTGRVNFFQYDENNNPELLFRLLQALFAGFHVLLGGGERVAHLEVIPGGLRQFIDRGLVKVREGRVHVRGDDQNH